MKIAVTGATGFVGRHLAAALAVNGDVVVPISRGNRGPTATPVNVTDADALTAAFSGCDVVVHLAGINFEREQSFIDAHVRGTRSVVGAAKRAGVPRVVMLSFLGARPDCGSPYHETKWEAEEIVRHSGLAYTIVKAGMIVGDGDHGLDSLARSIATIPMFATLPRTIVAPVAVDDVVRILDAAAHGRLDSCTVAAVGPDAMSLARMAWIVAGSLDRPLVVFATPLVVHRAIARVGEHIMRVPLVSRAQLTMLRENIVEPATNVDPLPAWLLPSVRLDRNFVRSNAPRGRFHLSDLRCTPQRWDLGARSVA